MTNSVQTLIFQQIFLKGNVVKFSSYVIEEIIRAVRQVGSSSGGTVQLLQIMNPSPACASFHKAPPPFCT